VTFPALESLADDSAIERTAWRVYMHLQRHLLDHTAPREVKAQALAQTLHLREASVIAALNQLVTRGYLIEHDKGARRVRRLTLAWTVARDSAA
jgi:DNA-binding MarR family transcriptional regulator